MRIALIEEQMWTLSLWYCTSRHCSVTVGLALLRPCLLYSSPVNPRTCNQKIRWALFQVDAAILSNSSPACLISRGEGDTVKTSDQQTTQGYLVTLCPLLTAPFSSAPPDA